MEKRIEVVNMRVGDIKTGFGNPRKISKKKRDELIQSLDGFGDFGVIVIDEHDNVIAGNQRVDVLKEKDPNQEVLCKRLIGYTVPELKAINIKANTHAGDWDMDLLADWTADLQVDLGLDKKDDDLYERKLQDMEPIAFEKYDYVMIVCRDTNSYDRLIEQLGLQGRKVKFSDKKRIKARAIWYDDIVNKSVLEVKK